MSNAARKARKRAGIKFEKAAKVGTPVEDRSFIWAPVFRGPRDAMPIGSGPFSMHRSPIRIAKFLKNGGVK